MKAIVLLSGGLDSTLAAKLVLNQGIDLEAVNFLTIFCTCTPKGQSCLASKHAVEQLGIGLRIFETSKEFIEIVKSPKHGYGRNMNPCIDCRIFMFRRAGQYMRETGSSFLVTGEVLGERPMSQRREAMMLIERESGLEGLIVRPLCAKLLKPSIPEERGWVDREELLAIRGRSRRPQIALAEDYSLKDYPCPAGGCRLTDPNFARRMKDLLEHSPGFTLHDVKLLKLGRHFRLTPETKLIVGRNEEENREMSGLTRPGDVILDAEHVPGPFAILRGMTDGDNVTMSASIVAAHTSQRNATKVELNIMTAADKCSAKRIGAVPARREAYKCLRI